MKSVRFSKVVEKSGRPEVYLLLSQTDADFNKALEAGKIMSLSDESHGAGTEYGTVGYDEKRHGQLLVFPKSLKPFADAKIIGIKYDLFAEAPGDHEKEASPSRTKEKKKGHEKPSTLLSKKAVKTPRKQNKSGPQPVPKKVIPFPAKKEQPAADDEGDLKASVRQALRALEKGNSVAAYNILKQGMSDA
jgi:hypothetical protein